MCAPDVWPVVVMYDMEIFTRFDMAMVNFVAQLLCGDLDCSFIGGTDDDDNRIDPSRIKFVSRIMPL